MAETHLTRLGRLAILSGLLLVLMGACQEPSKPDTELFEEAESCLRRGDYERATQLYQAFLEEAPNSPLAPVAARRLRNIDRELEAVMGRRHSPAPIYIRPPPPGEEESTRAPRGSPAGGSWDRFER